MQLIAVITEINIFHPAANNNPFEPEFTIVISFTTAVNCCRNSRLVVDEDDLK